MLLARRVLNSGIANRLASTLAVVVAIVSLAGLGWFGMGTREGTRLAEQRAIRVAELRGSIAYFEEWLTMSAQMAAVSGETRWTDRYNEAVPRLQAVIEEAVSLASPDVRVKLAETTDEAYHDLTQMTQAALTRATSGDREGARALLDSPEFSYLKAVYASGIEEFGEDLGNYATSRARLLNDRAWMELTGLGLGFVFIVAASLLHRGQSRLRKVLAESEAMARTDPLTGLPNRRRLYEELREALSGPESSDDQLAVLVLDLDRFKLVNDIHGHLAGDDLLRIAGERLQAVTRECDLIARLGGDEFAILARLDQPADQADRQNEEIAAELASRVVAVLAPPFHLCRGVTVRIGVSVGVALNESGRADAEIIMMRADLALYRAKLEGRGSYKFFEPGMDAQFRNRASLESDLRQAIENGEIVPYYQPLVSVRTECIVGYEMLARWIHPVRGMVSPAEFIPIAEEAGLVGLMTERLLRRACAVAAGWPEHVTLACNVSAVQLRDRELPAMVQAALHEAGLPAGRLELEITESALVGDFAVARELLLELHAIGVGLALDDFGTGYSSLTHLQRLPFDKLKIDASFVGAMSHDAESRKIVAAVLSLGRSLGLVTVAEGVENQAIATLLRDLGCDIGQGWLFGRPAPAVAAGARMHLVEERALAD